MGHSAPGFGAVGSSAAVAVLGMIERAQGPRPGSRVEHALPGELSSA